MKTLLFFAALAIGASAADYRLELGPGNTKVQFTLSDPLHTVHGTFTLRQGAVDFNTKTGKSSGQVIVDVASGNSGNDARDSKMHANVLESKKYPEAVFVPDHFDGILSVPGTSSLILHGIFTIHGASHEITVDTRTSATEDQIHATMTFDVPYVAWGMKDPGNFLLKVGKTVQMTVETGGPIKKR